MKKDVVIYFTGKLAPAVVNLAVIVFAVRLLGSDEFGKYSVVFYAAMLIGTLTFGWLQQSILRFYSAHKHERQLTVNRFLLLTLASSLFGALLGWIVSQFYFKLEPGEILIVAAYLVMYNLFLFRLTLFQASGKSASYAITEAIYNVAFILIFLALTLLLDYRKYLVLFIAMVAGLISAQILRRIILRKDDQEPDYRSLNFNGAFAKKVFNFGFPMTVWLFLSYLVNISDRFIIKEFTNYSDVGTYAAIKDFIIKMATFTTIPVLLSYHPMIVERWNNGKSSEAMALIREGLKYCFLIAVVVTGVFLVLHQYFYRMLLHLEVKDPLMLSVTLAISAFLWQAAMLIHKPLELLLRPGVMLFSIILALVVNAAANIWLVPKFGYSYAAIASLLSVVTYIITTLAFLIRFRKRGLLKPIV